MAIRTAAFLKRAVTQDSRLISQHIMRGGLALLVLLVFVNQLNLSTITFAAGRDFASYIFLCIYLFLTGLGLTYFAAAITEEKDEDTLPLLRMTGISNVGLLVGKSLPRLALVALFMLIAMPFLILSVTMGGVITRQIGITIVALLCYTLLLNQIGLLASTVSRTTRAAFSVATCACLVFELGFIAVWLLSATLESAGWIGWSESVLSLYSWLRQRSMYMSLDGYMMADSSDPVWYPQMTFHLVAAAAMFVASVLVFDRFNDRAMGQNAAQSAVKARSGRRRRFGITGRAWSNALLWKSWTYIVGGRFWFLLRLIGLPVFAFLLVIAICIAVQESPEPEMFAVAMIMLGAIFFTVEVGRGLGRVLSDEIHQKTLTSLCLLPRRLTSVVGPMIYGTLPVMIPGLACFIAGWWIMLLSNLNDFDEFIEVMFEPWFWHAWTWVLMTAVMTLTMSCWIRYGAFLGAIAVMFLLSMITGTMIGLLAMMFDGFGADGETIGRYLLPMGLIVAEFIACVVLLRFTFRRLEDLAGRS